MSSWSFLNSGTNFGSVVYGQSSISNGLGKTYGAELSIFKSFSEGWYLTATGTLIRQEFKASDGKWRNGAFDNQYIFNILAGYEWVISNDFTMEFSAKYTHAGGGPYTPIDLEQSALRRTTKYNDSEAFSLRNPDYKRFDIKIDFRQNFNGWAIISYFSVENLLNTQNILYRMYDINDEEVKTIYQIGLFPIGGVRIEF